MAGISQIVLDYQANTEVALFKYSAGAIGNIQTVETSSTLPNAVAFVQLVEQFKELMVKYKKLVNDDAESIYKYIEGLENADS